MIFTVQETVLVPNTLLLFILQDIPIHFLIFTLNTIIVTSGTLRSPNQYYSPRHLTVT